MFGGGTSQTAIDPTSGLPIPLTTTGTDTPFLSAVATTISPPWYVWAIGGLLLIVVLKR